MTRLSHLTYRNVLIAVHDLLVSVAALFAAFYIRFEGASTFWERVPLLLQILPYFIAFSFVVFYASNLMTTKWRFISLPDAVNIVRVATVLALAFLVLDYIIVAPNMRGTFFFGKLTIILFWFLEPNFHQDLNGDGTIGVPAGSSGVASLPAATASSTTTSFDGHTLTLSSPATFNGTIAGFGADGADQIDLNGISFSTLRTSFDSTATTWTVSDGSTTAQLHFAGASSPDGFHFADDQHGGTLLYAGGTPTASGSDQSVPFSGGNHDTFVFAQNFGQVSIANFAPATDSIAFSKAVFASQDALLAAIHDDANGNAAIVDAAHDTITLQHVTTAALLAHLSDLHIV